ncbi:MAG: hypothetical protein ASUL_06804 [Candidatus Aramenus sulfurataquae]|jgi:hypothetical protein|uniref:Uncharacterized protein n=2 Tax=Candidatus Aramenus sulfurataquae TaxID=1326980 RepID=W7KW56_9CREN|nr:MAG: hypothetical protein ASUL_06804 [Candidatus Aramenus sulfurataquae]MCL7343647.1 hypothetical protein [Candidatus Aramenus sulfurataquae]
MNVLLPALAGGFIITTALITFILIRRPRFSDTLIFYSTYAGYYMGLILYYFHMIVLGVITAFLVILPVLLWKFLKKLYI